MFVVAFLRKWVPLCLRSKVTPEVRNVLPQKEGWTHVSSSEMTFPWWKCKVIIMKVGEVSEIHQVEDLSFS